MNFDKWLYCFLFFNIFFFVENNSVKASSNFLWKNHTTYQSIIQIGKRYFTTDKKTRRSLRKPFHHLRTPLGKNLARILTRQKEEFLELDQSHRHSLTYGHWLKNITVDEKNVYFNKCDKNEESPYQEFCKTIYENIDLINNELNHSKLHFGDEEDLDAASDKKTREESFVEGHYVSSMGKTKYSKIFVTLYAESSLKGEDKVSGSRWLLPIEQAFLCSTLKAYRKSVAIPKVWGSYSRFALVAIPEDADVNFRFGLVKQQSFPSFEIPENTKYSIDNKKYKEENQKAKQQGEEETPEVYLPTEQNSKNEGKNKYYYEHPLLDFNSLYIPFSLKNLGKENKEEEASKLFYEYLPGGASQFYLIRSNKGCIYDMENALIFPCKHNNSSCTFSSIVREGTPRRKVVGKPKDAEKSHFFCESYDTTLIDFAGGLKKLGIIDIEEYADFTITLRVLNIFNEKQYKNIREKIRIEFNEELQKGNNKNKKYKSFGAFFDAWEEEIFKTANIDQYKQPVSKNRKCEHCEADIVTP